MYKLALILRYLRSRRITVIPILAVAVAVFLLIVVLSVMNGFSAFIQDKLRGTLADVIVEYDHVRGFEGYEQLVDRIGALDGVEAVSPHLEGKAMLTLYAGGDEGKAYDFPCRFIGIDPAAEDRVSSLGRMLSEASHPFGRDEPGEPPMPGMIVGAQVFSPNFEVATGVRASLTTPISIDEDRSMMFRITDRVKTGLYDYDREVIYVPLAEAQRLTETEGRVTGLHVRARDGADLIALRNRVAAVLPDDRRFTVKTWFEAEKMIIDATRLERVIWVVILSGLLAVAGFCILAVMGLTVLQKTRDIGILRSIGASVRGVLATFLQYGLTVGLIGATVGLLGAWLALIHLDPIEAFIKTYTGWTPWPRNVFYFDSIPREISPVTMFAFWGGGIIVSFLASVIPAIRAARVDPVATLRYEH